MSGERPVYQILDGSLSAVPKQSFATEYFFYSIFLNLQDWLTPYKKFCNDPNSKLKIVLSTKNDLNFPPKALIKFYQNVALNLAKR